MLSLLLSPIHPPTPETTPPKYGRVEEGGKMSSVASADCVRILSKADEPDEAKSEDTLAKAGRKKGITALLYQERKIHG